MYGKALARKLHRLSCPVLAEEADAMKECMARGIYIQHDLPDLERRFLHELPQLDSLLPLGKMSELARWRDSTRDARRVGYPNVTTLIEIEQAVLVTQEHVRPGLLSLARAEGWDLDALMEWIRSRTGDPDYLPSLCSMSIATGKAPEDYVLLSPKVAGSIIAIFVSLILTGLITLR